ncbi:hypothetical protein KR059_011860 [Drosophila kikkawai]|nr:hypothetical protein KR059_011860 [Drosophila kikkawai]
MSNQLERLLFFIVVISGALCTVEDFVIMSQCAHNKAIHLAAEGTVSVTDTSQIQNITIYGYTDYLNNKFKIALYAKETQRYLCFNDNWRLVGMRDLRETCYFKEALVHGYFVFSSLVDEKQRVGFTRRGKPVGPKKSLNDACYMFNKIDAEEFFRHHRLPERMVNASSSGNSRKPPRNNKNNRHKSNNQNQKLQQQQEHHGHNNNNNNNNVILNNSSTSLSSTNKKQLAINRQKQQQQQRQHQVRHHHNDPSLLLRRQQHEMKQKRRKQQKQQHEQQQQRATASPATAEATVPVAVAVTSPTTTKLSATTLSSRRKGRRRKGKAKIKAHQQQQLLATSATSPYTDDSLFSSSFSSTGFEDPDNSSSSLDPWSTWSTIDGFSSSSSTTTATDDSISSSSNYEAWATFISNQEMEASSISSSSTTPEMMAGNDSELLQYEPELVEDTDFVTDSEAAASTTYETKATSAIAATAATTTSTTGSQLVLEQTPLAKSKATVRSTTISTRVTPTAAANTGQTETSQSISQLNPGENEVKPRTFLWTTRATALQQSPPSSTPATFSSTSWTTPPQHVAPSLFSVDKNINSNLQNNTLTEASPTTATTGATAGGVTTPTTLRKPQRMFTRRLMATPFHRLAYVRNVGGDVDIDNLDNISVYPVEYDGDLDGNGGGSGNSSDGGFTGFLATSTTSKLTEPIRIGMKKIRQKSTLSGFGHRRNA